MQRNSPNMAQMSNEPAPRRARSAEASPNEPLTAIIGSRNTVIGTRGNLPLLDIIAKPFRHNYRARCGLSTGLLTGARSQT